MQLLQRLTKMPLWLLFLLSFVGAILLALWFPLLPAFQQAPPLDIRSFAPSAFHGLAYAALLGGLFAFNGLAAWQVWVQKRPLSLKQLGTTTILLGVPYLFIYPINANDIYRYVIRGRITSFYTQNPFLMPPIAFPNDPFTPFAGEWASVTTPYGPLWELVAGGLTLISGENLLLGLLLFKLLGLVALVGTAVLLFFLSQSSITPFKFAIPLLWAWNPALLLMFVGDAHNDGLMIFLLLLGYFISRRGRGLLGFWVLVLAVLVKPIALLALPFFFLALVRKVGNGRQKLRFILLSSVGSLLLLWLFDCYFYLFCCPSPWFVVFDHPHWPNRSAIIRIGSPGFVMVDLAWTRSRTFRSRYFCRLYFAGAQLSDLVCSLAFSVAACR